MTFTETIHCKSHAHCAVCRTDSAWRGKLQAPEKCPEGFTPDNLPQTSERRAPRKIRGLGDVIERIAKPIAKALNLPCLDPAGNLREESNCAKRRDRLNQKFPINA